MNSADHPGYPAAFYAELFDITERRVQQLAKENVIPKAGRGIYPLSGTVKGYVRYLQERTLTNGESEDRDIKGLKSRLIEAQAISIELKNAVAMAELAPIEVITEVVGKVCSQIAPEIDSIPLQVKRKHPELDAQVIESIKRHCIKALNAIARADEQLTELLDDVSVNAAAES